VVFIRRRALNPRMPGKCDERWRRLWLALRGGRSNSGHNQRDAKEKFC